MSASRIFVSYSHTDAAYCRRVVTALRDAGADAWYDEHNLGAGQLRQVIERELQTRSIFIVILSPSALRSRWVEDEVDWFHQLSRTDQSRIIIPVVAQAIKPDTIWLFFAQYATD
jgi:TIR domain